MARIPMHGEHHGRVFVGIDGPLGGTAWAQPKEGDPDFAVIDGLTLCSKETGYPVAKRRAVGVRRKAIQLRNVYRSLPSRSSGLILTREYDRIEHGNYKMRRASTHRVGRRSVKVRDENSP